MSRNKIAQRNTLSNPLADLVNILPCDRPIKTIQIVETPEACPINYSILLKALDTDSDADLFKENILFGKKNTRYICVSKTEGHPNFIVEQIRIINANENLASEGFISIKHTSDTNQKAWRKKQLVYKINKIENLKECVTDIVVMTKYNKQLVEGFKYLGELEKMHICYKVSPVKNDIIDFTHQIENLKIHSSIFPIIDEHYYETLKLSYQLPSPNDRPKPVRQAPLPPTNALASQSAATNYSNTGTLSQYHTDFVGVPFVLNKKFSFAAQEQSELPNFSGVRKDDEYDFSLERQILCATRGENRKSTSTNPFF